MVMRVYEVKIEGRKTSEWVIASSKKAATNKIRVRFPTQKIDVRSRGEANK